MQEFVAEVPAIEHNSAAWRKRGTWPVWLLAIAVCAGLTAYSETRAFVWDEGFHLVAAQMILAGKQPYLDFCFPQTPLNAYWNAGWMAVFGQSWRVTHVPAALELSATILLLTWHLLRRFPIPAWRNACAAAAVLLLGANSVLVVFAPISQAYAICMLAGLMAFLATVRATETESPLASFGAGVAAGVGAASSLLIAPIAPILLLWLLAKSRARLRQTSLFLLGCVLPFVPVILLFVRDPRPVFFNIVQYQALFRRIDWGDATGHDFEVLSAWVDCGPMLLMLLLGLAAIIAVHRTVLYTRERSEYHLALLCSIALVMYISIAHPTFSRYYLVGMPLFVMVAAPGLMVLSNKLLAPNRTVLSFAVLTIVVLLSLSRTMYGDRDSATWARYEEIAAQVKKVTPPGGEIYADEHVYFLLHRLPPRGMEFSYAHKLDLPKAEAQRYHVVSNKELEAQVKRGVYATFETCDDDKIDDWGVAKVFREKKDIADCSVFWGFQSKKADQ